MTFRVHFIVRGFMIELSIIFLSILFVSLFYIAAKLYLWFDYKRTRKIQMKQGQKQEAPTRRDIAKCQYIEEGLQDWLKMLKLPQFEEEKQLQEAARQLRIVLVERLMRGPKVR